MKSTVFSSVAIAALTTFVKAADFSSLTNHNCWMTLGAYTQGGSFCVAPLPDFTDQGGCMASQATCVQEYNDCKANTISASACIVLMSRCQILNTFCNKYCATDSTGNTPCNCNLSTANAWNGVDTLTTASCASAPVVNNQAASTPDPVDAPPSVDSPIATTAVPDAQPQQTTAAAVVAPPALIAPDVPCGQCFSDPGSGKRAFEQGPNYAPSGQRMTIGMCMGICQNAGYRYTGIEFGQECWCGNSFLNGAMPVAAASCSMTCAGDKTQTCGGNLFMNVYQTGCGAPTTPQALSTSSAVINKYASTAAAQYIPKPYTAPAYVARPSTAAAYVARPTTAQAQVYAARPTTAAAYAPKPTTAAYVAPAANTYVTYTPTVGICSIPTAYATPLGGYHAPIVACNDKAEFATYPWKRYNSHYTGSCPTYGYGWEAHACTEACTDQYNNCMNNWANTFTTYSSYSAYKVRRGVAPKNEKRTWWNYGGYGSGSTTSVSYGSRPAAIKETLTSAKAKCYAQYTACWNANRYLSVSGTCSAGGIYRAPQSQSGYNTYNSAAKSYGDYNTGNRWISQSSNGGYGGSTTENRQYW